MGWVMYKTHEGLNTYENESLEPKDTFEILRFIKNKFGERLKSEKEFWNIITDDIYNDLIINGMKINVSFDNWSGVFIMAMDESGNELVEEIAELIQLDKLLL